MRFIQKFDNAKGMSPYKYDNGKIYMIESVIGQCCYIGSTVRSLEHRFSQHCCDYRRGIYKSSAEVLQYPDAEIILILKYPCKSKYELLRKEGEFIKIHNKSLNRFSCILTYIIIFKIYIKRGDLNERSQIYTNERWR